MSRFDMKNGEVSIENISAQIPITKEQYDLLIRYWLQLVSRDANIGNAIFACASNVAGLRVLLGETSKEKAVAEFEALLDLFLDLNAEAQVGQTYAN